jgi:anti-sigma B factor antagonist
VDQLTIETVPDAPPDVRILRLIGPFTLASIWEFQAAIRGGTELTTIVDVTDVPYMDSAALGSVMGLHVSCQRLHRKYGLVGVGQRIRTLLQVAGVDGLLVTFPSMDEALQALAA